LSGEFVQVNRHLLKDLIHLNLWNDKLKQKLIAHNGSVQNMDEIPADLKEVYKTVWEIKQKRILELAADRGAFIDQSQSLNIHMTNCTHNKLSSMHFHGWKLGLKTGQYYLRTKAAVEAIKFTVEKEPVAEKATVEKSPSKTGGAAGGAEKVSEDEVQKRMKELAAEQEAKSKYDCVGCGS